VQNERFEDQISRDDDTIEGPKDNNQNKYVLWKGSYVDGKEQINNTN